MLERCCNSDLCTRYQKVIFLWTLETQLHVTSVRRKTQLEGDSLVFFKSVIKVPCWFLYSVSWVDSFIFPPSDEAVPSCNTSRNKTSSGSQTTHSRRCSTNSRKNREQRFWVNVNTQPFIYWFHTVTESLLDWAGDRCIREIRHWDHSSFTPTLKKLLPAPCFISNLQQMLLHSLSCWPVQSFVFCVF